MQENASMIVCSMCGHRFDASAHSACPSCPMQKGCQLVCCPSCGFETVDPERSAWARMAKRWLHLQPAKPVDTLADVPPGQRRRVRGFAPGISSERKAHLQAYGLSPGYWVRVLQHNPVTVVQVENTELALERDLARQVQVAGD